MHIVAVKCSKTLKLVVKHLKKVCLNKSKNQCPWKANSHSDSEIKWKMKTDNRI